MCGRGQSSAVTPRWKRSLVPRFFNDADRSAVSKMSQTLKSYRHSISREVHEQVFATASAKQRYSSCATSASEWRPN